MTKVILAQNEEIVIGVDVHDKKHQVAVVTKEGVVLKDAHLKPGKATWMKFLKRLPGCKVTVVYEAGLNGYNLYDLIKKLGHEAVVIAPVKHVGIKTDKRDARAIARDHLASRTRKVTPPKYEKRVRRQVLRTRNQLKEHMKRVKNQIASLKKFHGLSGELGSVEQDESGYLQFATDQLEEVVGFLQGKVKEMEAALKVIAKEEEYRLEMEALTEIKGVGLLCALEVVLGVADMKKFDTSDHFASYTGLCPSESSSGEKRRLGRITRRGPGRLRAVLVQSAWSRVRYDEEESKRYNKLKARIGARKAIVAVARRLSVRIWWKLNQLDNKPEDMVEAA